MRTKRFLLTAACVLALSPGLTLSLAQRSRPFMRYIFTDKDAVIVNRTEVLAPAEVHDAKFAPDGAYALALHEYTHLKGAAEMPDASDIAISGWYAGAHITKTLWRDKMFLNGSAKSIHWLPKSDAALVQVNGFKAENMPVTKLVWVNMAKETAREIPIAPGEDLIMNPVLPVALLKDTTPTGTSFKTVFRFLKADGTIGVTSEFSSADSYVETNWTTDGKRIQLRILENIINPEKIETKFYELNVADGTVKLLEKSMDMGPETPEAKPDTKPGSVFLTRTSHTLTQDSVNQATHPLWLGTKDKTPVANVLIAADCDEATLSPRGDAVMYRENGMAFVVPIVHMPKDPIYQVLKTIAISNAKQVGLGIMMYVQDYDEMFPVKDADIKSVVNPYVRSDEAFDKFVYYYPGENLAGVEKPAETILGIIPGPGGEAVVYADGHVKWRDKK